KPRLRRWEASQYLEQVHGVPLAAATLAELACIGGGPAFHRAGRIPLYPTTELDRWALQRLGPVVSSTSVLFDGAGTSRPIADRDEQPETIRTSTTRGS